MEDMNLGRLVGKKHPRGEESGCGKRMEKGMEKKMAKILYINICNCEEQKFKKSM